MKKAVIFLSLAALALPIALWATTLEKEEGNTVKQVSSQEEENEPLIFAGRIQSEEKVDLKFQASGKLAWVGVKKGDQVKKWQAIASLDKTDLEKSFKKKMNAYLKERWDFEQTQDDYQDEKDNFLVTDEIKRILDKAQWDLEDSVIDTEISQLAIKYATLVSPIEGIVTSIDQPVAGINITPATAVFTVVNPETLYFEVEVDEEEISQVREGMKGKIILDAYLNQEFESEIVSIDFAPMSEKTNTVYAVKATLPENKDLRFRLEMGGEIELPR